jgi:hypothetical protein
LHLSEGYRAELAARQEIDVVETLPIQEVKTLPTVPEGKHWFINLLVMVSWLAAIATVFALSN